jgi:MFS family permease
MGLTVGGFALIMPGLHLSYPWLIASAVLLGLANSVYHPANYAILSAHMNEARMGRAFSIHTFAGFLGGAVAPAIMAALVAMVGGRGALIAPVQWGRLSRCCCWWSAFPMRVPRTAGMQARRYQSKTSSHPPSSC